MRGQAAVPCQSPRRQTVTVRYHVLYSITYQVPVLYFFLDGLVSGASFNIDAVYECIVPKRNQEALKDTGIQGAIGMVVSLSASIQLPNTHFCRIILSMMYHASGSIPAKLLKR